MLYCVFPLESSAKHNKKAVQCTADFVIRATICEQAPIVPLTTKATRMSGFIVALCARDSGGIRTHDPQLRRLLLYPTELRNQSYFRCRSVVKMDCSPLKLRKSNTKFPICKISRCRIVKYQLFSPTLYLNQYFTTASQISRHTPTSPDIA